MSRTLNIYLHFFTVSILNKCMNYKQNIRLFFLTHETRVLSVYA